MEQWFAEVSSRMKGEHFVNRALNVIASNELHIQTTILASIHIHVQVVIRVALRRIRMRLLIKIAGIHLTIELSVPKIKFASLTHCCRSNRMTMTLIEQLPASAREALHSVHMYCPI